MKPTKPHVSEKKKEIVKKLQEMFTSHNLVGIADLREFPSKHLQLMKHNLRDKLKILVTKRRLIKLAIQAVKDKKDLSKIEEKLDECMPALLFSNQDPFSLYREIKKSKSKALAKPGQKAPYEIKIEPGPTEFPPGPIIGELGQMGIIAAVENGKVCIKKERIITKEGDVITPQIAQTLAKLKIEPMEIGLNVLGVISDGTYYDKEVLDVDEEQMKQDLISAHRDAFLLALSIGYVTDSTITPMLQKAAREANNISEKLSEKGIITSENIKKTLAKADSEAKVLESKVPELPAEEKKEEPKEEQPQEPKPETTPTPEPKQEETPKETAPTQAKDAALQKQEQSKESQSDSLSDSPKPTKTLEELHAEQDKKDEEQKITTEQIIQEAGKEEPEEKQEKPEKEEKPTEKTAPTQTKDAALQEQKDEQSKEFSEKIPNQIAKQKDDVPTARELAKRNKEKAEKEKQEKKIVAQSAAEFANSQSPKKRIPAKDSVKHEPDEETEKESEVAKKILDDLKEKEIKSKEE